MKTNRASEESLHGPGSRLLNPFIAPLCAHPTVLLENVLQVVELVLYKHLINLFARPRQKNPGVKEDFMQGLGLESVPRSWCVGAKCGDFPTSSSLPLSSLYQRLVLSLAMYRLKKL
jgi:hypothetical protein